MLRGLVCLVALLTPVSAMSETRLSAGAFERLVTGKTLSYSKSGVAFGIEEYFADRRVRWSFLDGDCQDGRWYPAGEMICFVYDQITTPQCWSFFLDDGALTARFENDPLASEVYQTGRSDGPLQCPGPRVGA